MSMGFQVQTPYQVRVRRSRQSLRDRLVTAASKAVDRASAGLLRETRGAMSSQRLGRLGNALGAGSDLRKGRKYVRRGATISTSGWVYVRSPSDRTMGALKSYTEGAEIRAVKGRWMAFSTDEIPKRAGRRRMTPALYESSGLDQRIGELEFVPGKTPAVAYLIVRDVTVNRARGYGKARRKPLRGAIGRTRTGKDFIVAFILIRRTRRTRRINPNALALRWHGQVPKFIRQFLDPAPLAGPSLGSTSTRFQI